MRQFRCISRFLLIACLVPACSRSPSQVSLPNGYELASVDGYWFINQPEGVELRRSHHSIAATDCAVPESIVAVRVANSLVFGRVEFDEFANYSTVELEGYFLLDTAANEVTLRLSESEISTMLAARHIDLDPSSLRDPASLGAIAR